MQKGSMAYVSGMQTATFGYNGNILGPTLLMHKGDEVVINVTNQLGEPTTTHWHGIGSTTQWITITWLSTKIAGAIRTRHSPPSVLCTIGTL